MRDAKIERIDVRAYQVPTDHPEADGTLAWDSTTMVLVTARAGGAWGLGYSYTHASATELIASRLGEVVRGTSALAPRAAWQAMVGAVRNFGHQGLAASAIAAVDVALWDLKARLLELPLVSLLGAYREAIPVYGSGGFTSYPVERLEAQLAGWVDSGIRMVKMKVGNEPEADLERVRTARVAIGPDAELFVDANGAYDRKQALAFAEQFAAHDVTWFEEPVSSDDLAGLRLLRDRAPAGMDITAGEYGYDLHYFRRMLEAGAVDVLQPDATRCLGITGFMHAEALCRCYGMPLSAHTAPSIHTHLCCAAETARHIEYFHDHVRTEEMLLESLLVFAKAHGLSAAEFTGLGALSDAVLGYFDWQQKDYTRIPIDEQVEVLNLTGNIALADGEPKLHPHIVLGKADGTACGGHLLEAHVRARRSR